MCRRRSRRVQKYVALFEELKNELQGVEDSFNQLKNNEKFSINDLEVRVTVIL